MNAAIQAVDVRKEAGQWFKALMLAGLILVLNRTDQTTLSLLG